MYIVVLYLIDLTNKRCVQKVHLILRTSSIKYWHYGSVLGPDFGPKVRTESEIRTFQKSGLSSIPKNAQKRLKQPKN